MKKHIAGLGLVVAFAIFFCCDSPSSPSLSSGYIYFVSSRYGPAQIFRMNEDGSNVIAITNDAHSNHSPAISTQGRLAFISTRDASTPYDPGRLYVDDQRVSRLDRDYPGDLSPTWFSENLLLVVNPGMGFFPKYRLYWVNTETAERWPFLESTSHQIIAAIHPNRKVIAVVEANRSRNSRGTYISLYQLYGYRPVKMITNFPGAVQGAPAWNEAGNRLAFLALREGVGQGGYWSMFVAGWSGTLQWTRHIGTGGSSQSVICWSGNNRSIYYAQKVSANQSQNGKANLEIFSIDVQTGTTTRITYNDAEDWWPVWVRK